MLLLLFLFVQETNLWSLLQSQFLSRAIQSVCGQWCSVYVHPWFFLTRFVSTASRSTGFIVTLLTDLESDLGRLINYVYGTVSIFRCQHVGNSIGRLNNCHPFPLFESYRSSGDVFDHDLYSIGTWFKESVGRYCTKSSFPFFVLLKWLYCHINTFIICTMFNWAFEQTR